MSRNYWPSPVDDFLPRVEIMRENMKRAHGRVFGDPQPGLSSSTTYVRGSATRV